jgi:hypothetical protein
MRRILALLLPWCLLGTGVARAQDPGTPDGAPPGAAALENGLNARFVWEHRGNFRQRGAVTGVAVSVPDADGVRTWLAIDEKGWTWRSTDEGATWVLVLRGEDADAGPDEEQVLLDAEVLRDETVDLDPGSGEAPDLDAVRDQVSDANQTATRDGVNGAEGRGAVAPRVWFYGDSAGTALLGRADGTWRSEDGGYNWELVDEVPTTALYSDGSLVVAGTADGVRWSLDGGGAWFDVEDATDGTMVRGIARSGSWVYAATSRGLYRSADGLAWQAANALRGEPVLEVVPDPGWTGGLWVVTRDGLQRTDDDGATFYPVERAMLKDIRRVVALPGRGHLLALTGDGPWESTDGGVKWLPAQRLLRDPDVRDVAFHDGWPVIVARTGVYRLVEPVQLADRPRAIPLPPIGDMVRRAQERPGLTTDLLALSRLRFVAALAPQMDVTFDWGSMVGRTADYLDLSNTGAEDGQWTIVARTCWGACATQSSTAFYDPTDPALLDDASLFVVGDEVYDPNDSIAAAANVAQGIRAYRQTVASTVAEAWTARQRLNQEQAVVDLLPLKDQVVHALAIAEADARLDLYTDGAFSRQLAILQAQPQEPR